MARLRVLLFVALLLTAAVTYFTSTSVRTIKQIRPECLAEPFQTATTRTNVIAFTRDGYRYRCTPLFDYSISGLVVHKLDYSWFAIDHSEKAFPVDLCIVWGDNLQHGLYRNDTVKFSQDCRFCFAEWGAGVPFQMDQLSNNHLVVSDPAVQKQLQRIRAGDQVTVRGQLVNVHGELIGAGSQYDSLTTDWNTSTTRTDTGPGACEVIYVEGVTVLKPGHPLSHGLFLGSLCGAGLMILWSAVKLFLP